MTKLTAMEIKLVNAMRSNEYGDALQEGTTWTFTAIDNSGIVAKQARGVISSLVQKGLVVSELGNKKTGDEDTIWFTDTGKKLFDNADGEDCSWGGPKLLKEIVGCEVCGDKGYIEHSRNHKDGSVVEKFPCKACAPKEVDKVAADKEIIKKATKEIKAAAKKKFTPKEVQARDEARRAEMKKAKEVEIVAFTGMVLGTFKVDIETEKSIQIKTKSGKLMIFDKKTGIQTDAKNAKFANKIK